MKKKKLDYEFSFFFRFQVSAITSFGKGVASCQFVFVFFFSSSHCWDSFALIVPEVFVDFTSVKLFRDIHLGSP